MFMKRLIYQVKISEGLTAVGAWYISIWVVRTTLLRIYLFCALDLILSNFPDVQFAVTLHSTCPVFIIESIYFYAISQYTYINIYFNTGQGNIILSWLMFEIYGSSLSFGFYLIFLNLNTLFDLNISRIYEHVSFCAQLIRNGHTILQWNLYNKTGAVLIKTQIITLFWQSLQNHIDTPYRERPPVLRDHSI